MVSQFIHRKYSEYVDRDVCFVKAHLTFFTRHVRFYVAKETIPHIIMEPFSYSFLRAVLDRTPDFYNGLFLLTANGTNFGFSVMELHSFKTYNLVIYYKNYMHEDVSLSKFIEIFNKP